VIFGGLVVIALFAALIGPWFINWDDYKANFEAEASRILGQPVRVLGTADATILPSPSLTFTNVQVGDTEGQPMMTVERFAVTIELMPLLQGEIHVISMKLDKPVVRVSVDDAGQVDWLLRSSPARELDPESVALNGVEVKDGTVYYTDAGAGSTIALDHVQASIEARSLDGPWRIEGSYASDGIPVQFTVSTGRLTGGALRLKVDATPGQWPIAIATDGTITGSPTGPAYSGTYDVTQIVAAEDGKTGDTAGWSSQGSFSLTRDQLVIDKAVLSEGPPDRPSSLAGSLSVEFGKDARFEATAQARQLDLDRSLGGGPTKPVEVGAAATQFVEWLAGIPVPPIPGQIRFNVPGIVVGGNVIQDVRFTAMPEDHGWQIQGLQARLPGQTTFQADGRLSTGDHVGFGGAVHLAVGQPATFAAWWRGNGQEGAGRLLAPFDLSGRATINLGGIAVEDMVTKIDDATISGGFSWSRASADSPERRLRTDLRADRLDFVQIRALAELLGGRDFSDATAIADSYTIKLKAGELAVEDVSVRDVTIDASFVGGGLTVNGIEIGDIGGASFKVTRGQIDNVLTEPLGRLEAQLTAGTLTGLARVVDRVAPDTQFSKWFTQAAPSLAPASLGVTIDSIMTDGEPNSRLDIKGSAGATNFDATIELAGSPAVWRAGHARLTASLKSYDAAGVARQIGLDPADVSVGGASANVSAVGVPEDGLDASLQGSFGGLTVESAGKLTLGAGLPLTYAGSFSLATDDAEPLIRLAGLGIPGAALGTPVRLKGDVSGLGPTAEFSWTNGEIAGRAVSGKVRVAEGDDGGLSLEDGSLEVDSVDAGWIASLGLGFSPLPTDDPEAPWSKTPFDEPVFGHIAAQVDIAAQQLTIGNSLRVSNAKLRLAMSPNRVDFDVKSGETEGGTVAGGVTIRNVGGNANVTGRLSLVGASLESIIWQRSGRSVATGTLDLSGDFEANGRSPAGLISSLTGGGTLAIHNGEARYVNPRAANLVIRASDLGQQFDETQLRDLFASYIDGGSFGFAEADAAFSVAAGTLRIQNMTVKTDAAGASGSAAIDFNTMTIDSDWTLTLDPGDVESNGPPPQVGIVFRGPLSAPNRIFDVLQFSSFLNIRQEERIQQILELEQEARLEKERLGRLMRKEREDEQRAKREAEAARQARIDAASNIEDLHVAREIHAEVTAEKELAAWHDAAVAAAEAKAAALQAATDAAAVADAERQDAQAAVAKVEEIKSAVNQAGGVQETATNALDQAQAALDEAKQAAADRQKAAEAADQRLAAAQKRLDDAKAAATDAAAKTAAARKEAEAAAASTKAALAAVDQAERAADDRKAEAKAAAAKAAELDATAGGLEAAASAAAGDLTAAIADAAAKADLESALAARLKEAESEAASSAKQAATAEAAAKKAEGALSVGEGLAEGAQEGLAKAKDASQAADQAAAEAETRLTAAQVAAEQASQTVEKARRTVAQLDKPSDVTLGGGTTFGNDAARLAAAQKAAQDAEDALAAAEGQVADAEAGVAQAADEATARSQAADAARIAADKASSEAEALVEPANTARAKADAAKAAAAVAAATATAAKTAAEKAVEDVKNAKATVKGADKAHQAAVDAATAARAQAEDAAAKAETAAADADAGAKAAATARLTAKGAAEDQSRAEQVVADAAAAEKTAEDALAAAGGDREQAGKAADDAAAELAAAKDAVGAATAGVEEKAQLEAQALKAAAAALDKLHAAQDAAAAAAQKADEAEAAARQAAERAAEMPRSWLPSEHANDRADAGVPKGTITEAVIKAERDDKIADVPGINEVTSVTPVAEAPIIVPRLRPDRSPAARSESARLPDPMPILPTDAQPLVITPPLNN
jgi:uncharacterized protein involved in outer membrane biogenesis